MRNLLPPQELLDDLCSRFVLNVPKEDLESFERILFLVEQAHWFYEDNSVEQNPSLKSLSLREFAILMFKSCAALRPYIPHMDDIYKDFTTYKFRVPVTGAIILDESNDRVLEETGCDISEFLEVNDFIEVVIGQQRVRLYIVTGVKEDTIFAPQTKKEISEISWIPINDLLPSGDDSVSRAGNGLKLYMVAPFLTPLRTWISNNYPGSSRKLDHKGTTCLWKTKINSSGSTIQVSQQQQPESSQTKPVAAAAAESKQQSVPSPGESFRNFKFDTKRIMQSLTDSFSAK